MRELALTDNTCGRHYRLGSPVPAHAGAECQLQEPLAASERPHVRGPWSDSLHTRNPPAPVRGYMRWPRSFQHTLQEREPRSWLSGPGGPGSSTWVAGAVRGQGGVWKLVAGLGEAEPGREEARRPALHCLVRGQTHPQAPGATWLSGWGVVTLPATLRSLSCLLKPPGWQGQRKETGRGQGWVIPAWTDPA